MRFYADLHVHSKYSRATSRDADLEHLALWAKRKGLRVVGTGDFTHPAWWQELQDKLEPAEPGLWRLRPELERAVDAQVPAACRRPVSFLLEVEISTIYKKGEKTRKVHHLIYAAEMATAGRFRDALGRIGNISSDGRPILGLDSRHLLEIALQSGDDAYLIPAHIWTPWFSALGSKSGFDRIEDCYGDLAPHIFAVETGLSSDPPMNWRVSHLDRFTLVSNSDAHSPPVLGREACVFLGEPDYFAMRHALATREGWGGTVEFFPEEGKYHLDGHRACEQRLEPEETRRHGGRCPSCGKEVTVGVLHRVEALADRPAGALPAATAPFRSLVQLPEVLAEIHGVGAKSKAVEESQRRLADQLGPELELLEQAPLEEIRRRAHPLLAEAVDRLRRGQVRRESGYDGEYGVIRVFAPGEIQPQLRLFAPPPPVSGPKPASAPARPATTPAPAAPTAAEEAAPSFDEEQAAAIQHLEGPLLIVAGPGAGKTRTLTHRLARQIAAGAAPERCLVLTFTRRAADELRERLGSLLGEAAERVPVRTFHGLGFEILRSEPAAFGLPAAFRLADAAMTAEWLGERRGMAKKAARRLREQVVEAQRARVLGRPDAEAPAELDMASYRRLLAEDGLVDLEDLLLLPVETLSADPALAARWRDRYDHLAVDEYQDVDGVQYRLLRLLSGANLCVIGDPDQAIYGFRGADVGHFLRFEQDYPGARRIELGRNYRSQPAIVEAASQAIAPSSLAPGRRFVAASGRPPAPIAVIEAEDERAEAAAIARTIEELLGGFSLLAHDRQSHAAAGARDDLSFDDIAVLYRSSAQAGPIEEALAAAGIPCQRRSHERLIDLDQVRLLLHRLAALRELEPDATRPIADWLALAREGADDPAACDAAIALLKPLADRRGHRLDAFLADLATGAEVDTWNPRAERVALLTLHAAKGLEFPVVFLAGCEDELLPWQLHPGADLAEERRLFFVGLTRAQNRLYLSRCCSRLWRGERRPAEPSRFLADLPPRLLAERRERARPASPALRQLGLF